MENENRAAEFGREGRLVNLNPVLILEFYFRVSGSCLFTSATVRILVHITPKCGTAPI